MLRSTAGIAVSFCLAACAYSNNAHRQNETAVSVRENGACSNALRDARSLNIDAESTGSTETERRSSESAWNAARQACHAGWQHQAEYNAAIEAIRESRTADCEQAFSVANRGNTVDADQGALNDLQKHWDEAVQVCGHLWSPEKENFHVAAVAMIENRRSELDAPQSPEQAAQCNDAVHDIVRSISEVDLDKATTALGDARLHCTTPAAQRDLRAVEQQLRAMQHKCGVPADSADTAQLLNFVAQVRLGLDPSRSIGCVYRAHVIVVLNSTRDGWTIVNPATGRADAAIRASRPLMNGTMLQHRRVRFVRMMEFTTIAGDVAVLPAFQLLDN